MNARGKNIPEKHASDNRPVPKVRIAPIATRIMESLGVATAEIVTRADTYKLMELLMSLNRQQLDDVIENPVTPVSILTYAEALKKDLKEGKVGTILALMERVYGKASQKIEVDANVEDKPLELEKFKTREDYMRYLKKMSAEMGFLSDALDVDYEEVEGGTTEDD